MPRRPSSLEVSRETQPVASASTPPPASPSSPRSSSSSRSSTPAAVDEAEAAQDTPELDYFRYDANVILDALLRMTATASPTSAGGASDVRTTRGTAEASGATPQLPSAATPSRSLLGRSPTPSDGPTYLGTTRGAGNIAAPAAATSTPSATTSTTSGVTSHTPAANPLATPVTGTRAASHRHRPHHHHHPSGEQHGRHDVEREVSVERMVHNRHPSVGVAGRATNSTDSTTSYALDPAAMSTGLVFSAHATPSATSASHVSPQAEARLRAAHLTTPSASAAHAAAAGVGRGAHAPAGRSPASPTARPSTALSLDTVGGQRWQDAFAATAQQLLRETHEQVEELRRYRSRALREAQRADALAAAQKALEAQLTDVTQQRAQDKLAHQRATQELSHQALRLEEAVGLLRRSKVDLQRQLQQARTDAAEAKRVHAAEVHQLREEHVRLDGVARAAHQHLEEERAAWIAKEAALQQELETRRAREVQRMQDMNSAAAAAAALPAVPVQPARADAVAASETSSTKSVSSSYERVHRDVLAQQHLREEIVFAELEKAKARLQQESAQRRTAEAHVAALLEQNAVLQETLAATPPREYTPQRVDAHCHTVDATPRVVDAVALLHQEQEVREADLQAERQRHAAQEQEYAVTLRGLQQEYALLLEASDELAARLAGRASDGTEQWAALRNGVVSVIRTADVHDDDLHVIYAELATDASAAGGDDIVRALQQLVRVLRAQRDAAAVAAQAELEQRRLSNFDDAVQAAEAQNRERLASLEATQLELHEARRTLAAWEQRQQALTARQDAQEAAVRTAQGQLQQVVSVARRAMREYGRPLSGVLLRAEDAAGDSLPRDNTDGGLQVRGASVLSSASIVSSTAHSAAAAAAPAAAAAAVDATPTASTAGRALPQGDKRGADPLLLHRGEVAQEEGSASSPSPSTVALQPHGSADGASQSSGCTDITADATSVSKVFFKLLAAWRQRQHRLVESRTVLERKLAGMEVQHRAAVEQHKASATHLQQQLRSTSAAAQRHADKAEELLRALDAATQLHATEEVRARQRVAALETEREALQRRLQSTERQLHTAEQALVESDVGRSQHGAALAALQDALGNTVDERDRLARHETDLRVHTEDLEARLEEATGNESALHALLSSCVTSLVRLLADHQQLRAHYHVLRAVTARDETRLAVVEGVLLASVSGGSGGTSAPLLMPPPRSLTAPPRLRSVVYAVCVVGRLACLATHRHRVLQHDDSNTPASLAAVGVDATLPSLLLALSSPEAVAAVALDAAHEGAALASTTARLLRRYTTSSRSGAAPAGCVWPVVRLPPPSELAKAHREGINANTSHPGAAVDGHAQRLLYLLTVAQLDTQAAATRHVWSGMLAAASTCVAGQAQVQLELRMRRAWRHALGETRPTQPLPVLPDFSELLPRRLAALLQRQLATSALQARQLTEANTMVQRLVHQNDTLVTALEKRSSAHEGALAELDGIRAELRERLATQDEVAAVQARLVDAQAALMQDRKQRREAESRLAKLTEERLKWIVEHETHKREMYALHMELAHAAAAPAAPAPAASSAQQSGSPAFLKATQAIGAPDTTGLSALTIETEEPTLMSQGSERLQRRKRFPDTPSDAPVSRAGVLTASEGHWRRNVENAYYERLLRRENSSATGAVRDGDGDGGRNPRTNPSSLEYVPRFNLPAPHEICQPTPSNGGQPPTHGTHAMPPPPPPQVRATKSLELFVPHIVRRQENWQPPEEVPAAPAPVHSASDGVAFSTAATVHAPTAGIVDSAATPPPLDRHVPRRPTATPLASPPAPQVKLYRDDRVLVRVPNTVGVPPPRERTPNASTAPQRTHAASPPPSSTLQHQQQQPSSPSLLAFAGRLRPVAHAPTAAGAAGAPSRSTSERLSYPASADTHTEAPTSAREPSASTLGRHCDPSQPVSGPLYFTARAAR